MNNELVPQPSWWKRNWKWALPVGGCLGIIIFAVVLFTSIYFGVTKIMEESEPYVEAFALIHEDEALLQVMGSPITRDGAVQGSINNKNGNKTAQMTIPIAGPDASGTLYVDAYGRGEIWKYHEITVQVGNQEFDFTDRLKNLKKN
ncbi:Hypothetical protein I595_1310 [Croceitalea dokdonensis DOKDO 023]|uniref:Cytochrome oxidase complex assembly protein 1 n=1 Tax=Croceitalea dokdonensis DOKDO 023 TaxID=1300341 RepID=A0A0P7ALU1_9FLAO|nr:cytochrome c oxidase assembly factor Coa1 family protein [Croceitalea dokdonensis]KPM32883.1 Hypothetical protein I595_1310 [Croceitalea dokdonensis DOKDO 023]